jgi:hypothetical protein
MLVMLVAAAEGLAVKPGNSIHPACWPHESFGVDSFCLLLVLSLSLSLVEDIYDYDYGFLQCL